MLYARLPPAAASIDGRLDPDGSQFSPPHASAQLGAKQRLVPVERVAADMTLILLAAEAAVEEDRRGGGRRDERGRADFAGAANERFGYR